jgi:hypothetical protein
MPLAASRLRIGAVVCIVLGAAGLLIVLGGTSMALLEPGPPAWLVLAFSVLGAACTAPVLIAGLGLLRKREWARRLIAAFLQGAVVYFILALALPPLIIVLNPHVWTDRVSEFLVLYLCGKALCLFLVWRALRFFKSSPVRQVTVAA